MSRKIIHCDADCFFAALEMRDDQSLRGIPMAVGGDPSKRGVISTCNYEARAFGVRSALASAYAKRLCPQLIIVPHNMPKYREAANHLKEIFLQYTDIIEPLSLDEAFLDVSHVEQFKGSATLMAEAIRQQVYREIGITISAGVAPNKFLAKVASDWKKPDGLTVIEPSRVKFFMKQLPVGCIPGVGERTRLRLQAEGIENCVQLSLLSEWELVERFGKFGSRLYHFSRGDDERPVSSKGFRKSMSVEHTVEKDLSPDDCRGLLEHLHQKLYQRLNLLSEGYKIKKVFVKVKFMDFTRTTIESCMDTLEVSVCESLFQTAWQRYQRPVRLLGVGVRFHDVDCDSMQLSLLPDAQDNQDKGSRSFHS